MKKAVITLILVLACMIYGNAQSNLNDYKYVIVPSQFNFLKEADQYRLNSLTEFLFNKYGFIAILQGNPYPDDLISNGCLAVNSEVVKGKSLLKTKLTVVLKDCKGQVIYTSREGVTKEKDFGKAYNLALRDAFKSFENMNYSYVPNKDMASQSSKKESNEKVAEANKEVVKLKAEIEELKKDKKKVVELKAVKRTKTSKDMFKLQKGNDELKEVKKINEINAKVESNILYAQATGNGFQLVDSSPKVVMILQSTALDNVFVVKDKNAIVFKQDGFWYYSNNETSIEALNIKF